MDSISLHHLDDLWELVESFAQHSFSPEAQQRTPLVERIDYRSPRSHWLWRSPMPTFLPSNELAFNLLALLNLPAFAFVQYVWLGPPKKQTRMVGGRIFTVQDTRSVDMDPAKVSHARLRPHLDMFALSRRHARHRPWTLLTSAFVHIDVSHFFANMCALFVLAKELRHVTGLTNMHVLSITIGSSLFSSLVWLTKEEPWTQSRTPTYSFGFSAVLNSFAAIRTALLFRLHSYGIEEASRALVVPALQIGCDVWGLFTERSVVQPSEFGLSKRINYAAHLAGAGFGFMYYYAILRR